MSTSSKIRVILSFIALQLGAPLHADHYKVFLLGGQSNMWGTGAPTSQLPLALQSPQDDVLFYHNSSTALIPLQPGTSQDFGPEVTFGRTVADAFPADHFCLIKYAVGGSDLSGAWDPTTGTVYADFRTKVADGLAALTAAGHTYEIVGMLWTQGERDARIGRTTAQYQADLIEFIADIRTRYGANLPFFLNRLSIAQTDIPDITQVRAAQENVAATDVLAFLIDSDGLSVSTADNLHYDAPGQIALGEAFALSYVNFITPDEIAPDINSLTPAHTATEVDPWTNLTITFNEQVIFGTGSINLRLANGTLVESFDVASPPANLTLSGASITIDPTNLLAASTGHYLEIAATAIADLAGNSFAGFIGGGTWSFTTAAADTNPPAIQSLSPAHLATEIDTRSNLEIVFTENVALGTGSITLRRSDGTLVEAFDVGSPPANLAHSGATITLDPSSDLAASAGYYVEIDATAIDDFSGNSFAGISGSGTWSFSSSTSVLINGSGITASASSTFNSTSTRAELTIDGSGMDGDTHGTSTQQSWMSAQNGTEDQEWIQWNLGTTYILDFIHVWNYNDATRFDAGINQVDIYVSALPNPGDPEGAGAGDWTLIGENVNLPIGPGSTSYTGFDLETTTGITLPGTAVQWVRFEVDSTHWDGASPGNLLPDAAGLSEIRFFGSVTSGSDTTPPGIGLLNPAHASSGVNPSSNLMITFNESVAFGTGAIRIRKTTDDTVIESFDVSGPAAGLSLSGATLTINPSSDLDASTGYYVEIDATAIDDLAGNSFAGFSGNGIWSFTAAAAPSSGGLITTGITATASSFINANNAPSKTIDNSGMTGDEHNTSTQNSWASTDTNNLANEWIQWDLGSTYVLGSIRVWNYNDLSRYASGIRQLDIYVSAVANPGDPEGAESANWTNIGNNVTIPAATALATYTGFDLETATGISLPGTAVRWVRFEVNSNYYGLLAGGTGLGPDQAALSEIRFFEATGPPSNTFADWIGGFTGLGGLTAFDEDADADGIMNGIEAFFGTAPNAPNAGLAAVAVSGSSLSFTHPLANPPLTNVIGSYEWSLDLATWNASGDDAGGTIVTIGVVQDTPESGTTTVTSTVTGTEPSKVFVRVVATQN